MNPPQTGRLVILSGPSGSGKSTVVAELLKQCDLPLVLSVSATTRPPRPGEIDGKHYFFVSDEEFERRRTDGAFLEWKEVFGRGHYYGTLRDQVATGLKHGRWVILEIDVEGALTVLDGGGFDPITLFIDAGDMERLERRLRDRGTEPESAIRRRLDTARREITQRHRYQHHVINDELDRTVGEVCSILKSYAAPGV